MSKNPNPIEPYKSNLETKAGATLNDKKLTSFAVDPAATRTGRHADEAMKLRLGDSIMHVAPTARDVSCLIWSLQFILSLVVIPLEALYRQCTKRKSRRGRIPRFPRKEQVEGDLAAFFHSLQSIKSWDIRRGSRRLENVHIDSEQTDKEVWAHAPQESILSSEHIQWSAENSNGETAHK